MLQYVQLCVVVFIDRGWGWGGGCWGWGGVGGLWGWSVVDAYQNFSKIPLKDTKN